MKFGKTVAIVLTSTVLLAGCTTDKKEIKKYDNQVQKAFDQENSVNSTSKKINGKDQNTRKQAAEDIVKNVEKRKKEFKNEEQALNNSEKEFKKAKQYTNHIDNSAKKKEVTQLNDALKEKYEAHDAYAKAYKKALNKEKELFTFLNQDGATQSEVDSKSKDLSKAYKDMNKKFNTYSKAMRKVTQEKQDVDQLK